MFVGRSKTSDDGRSLEMRVLEQHHLTISLQALVKCHSLIITINVLRHYIRHDHAALIWQKIGKKGTKMFNSKWRSITIICHEQHIHHTSVQYTDARNQPISIIIRHRTGPRGQLYLWWCYLKMQFRGND